MRKLFVIACAVVALGIGFMPTAPASEMRGGQAVLECCGGGWGGGGGYGWGGGRGGRGGWGGWGHRGGGYGRY